jgi:hypothetical protein
MPMKLASPKLGMDSVTNYGEEISNNIVHFYESRVAKILVRDQSYNLLIRSKR